MKRLWSILWLCIASLAFADGFIIIPEPPPWPHPPPPHPRPIPWHHPHLFAPMEVIRHQVQVEIDGQAAVTQVDQVFRNPNLTRLEGIYFFPLPEGAAPEKFEMELNGKAVQAELMDADKARGLYEDIVRKMQDPALLEYAGRGAFRMRIFPIEPNSECRVKLKYSQFLVAGSGFAEYRYPLNTEKFSAAPLQEASVTVALKSPQPLGVLYSPSHPVTITRPDANRATVVWSAKRVLPDSDFRLVFSTAQSGFGMSLLSQADGPAKGWFLLLASPAYVEAKAAAVSKDVCFVLDTSGSMADGKLDQAKKSLKFCLENLNVGDRFEVIRFSTEAEALFGTLVKPETVNLAKAKEFIDGLKPIGGTAIHEALGKALALPAEAGRPSVVIFLTDGIPTIGECREDEILTAVKKSAANRRIFSFGIGTDVNAHLLDRIGGETRAFSQYVLPKEDLELKVSSFYSKIQAPQLTDVALTIDGMKTTDLLPRAMPDLFKDDTVAVFGRYEDIPVREIGAPVDLKVRLSGLVNGVRKEFLLETKLDPKANGCGYIPVLWASRRIAWLLDQIRMNGESKEVREEIVRLARQYGIVTPYTSYLILEDERQPSPPGIVPVPRPPMPIPMARDAIMPAAKAAYDSLPQEAASEASRSGARAVHNAMHLRLMGDAGNLAEHDAGLRRSWDGGDEAPTPAAVVRIVEGRAFYQDQNGQWTDGRLLAATTALKKQEIRFASPEYFELSRKHPEVVAWLALGNWLQFELDGQWIVIIPGFKL